MNIEKAKGHHYIQDRTGKMIGEITFIETDEHTVMIEHTFVDEDHRGDGVARELVDSVVQEMKRENKKIIPACRFAAVLFERIPSYKEQMAK
ncbi:GNAT family N-acetyltransferase [Cytobacillus horneckiae]|uniref:GNAT family N-acetyltransferase n=1 Tax=Cytobacillus horneckiae TaxID=549687 RepID=UPI0034CDE229